MTLLTDKARRWAPLLLAAALSACATTNPALEQSQADFARSDPLAAYIALEDAVRRDPANLELRAWWLRQRELLGADYLAAAEQARLRGQFEEAERLYRDVQRVHPTHPRARAGLDAVLAERRRAGRLAEGERALARGDTDAAERLARSVLAEAPAHPRARRLVREADERRVRAAPVQALEGALARPVNLQFRDAPLRVVFEALSRAAGLNFVLDSELRQDAQVSLFVRDTSVDEVLKLLVASQQIERKLLNANSVLIYPATPAKQREYQDLVSRSFYLSHADAKQAQAMLKQLVKTRDIFIDEKLNLVVVKDTPEAVRVAERLIATLDVAEPEVVLEVEVLEVSRSKLRDLGLQFPNEVGYGRLENQDGGELADGFINLERNDGLVPFVSNPAAVLRLRHDDGDIRLLANPRIRVKNRNDAKIHIGEKVPVFTTTSTANVGVSASVSYLDVGIRLDAQPSVTLDDEVSIKVDLEVSNIVREVPGPDGSLAYRIGRRSASTTLRLQDGETQVLAGLINDEERRSASRLPGLGELPVLGRLFSAERSDVAKTEIVLLITPRIVRNVVAPAFARDNLAFGTEAVVGAAPLRLAPTAADSFALSGSGAGLAGGGLPLPSPAPVVTEAAAGPAELALSIGAPERVAPGELIDLRLELQGSGSHGGGVLEFDYDATRLEPVGFAGPGEGRGTLAIPPGSLPTTLALAFRARAGAEGSAQVVVSSVVFEVDGERRAMPLGGTAAVAIGQ